MEFKLDKQDNRRSSQRVVLGESIQFENIDRKEFGGSIGFNISEGGLRMKFNNYVSVGTELSLRITLPDHSVVESTGIVMWVKKDSFNDQYQAGIQFEVADNVIDSREKIHHYIESFQS